MPSPLFFLSDAHLGAPLLDDDKIREKKLIQFLEYAASEQGAIYIVGDLFEFWFEYRESIPKKNFAVLATLYQIRASSVEVHYLAGNHDLWLGPFLRDELGLKIHHYATSITLNGFNIFVTHGDGIARQDRGYRILKKIMTHPVNISLYRLIHPDLGIPFAKRMSQISRGNEETKNGWDADYKKFAAQKFAEGFNVVIMGHTHNPLHEKMGLKHYINLGDWIDHYTYCRITGENIDLFKWPSQKTIAISNKSVTEL